MRREHHEPRDPHSNPVRSTPTSNADDRTTRAFERAREGTDRYGDAVEPGEGDVAPDIPPAKAVVDPERNLPSEVEAVGEVDRELAWMAGFEGDARYNSLREAGERHHAKKEKGPAKPER